MRGLSTNSNVNNAEPVEQVVRLQQAGRQAAEPDVGGLRKALIKKKRVKFSLHLPEANRKPVHAQTGQKTRWGVRSVSGSKMFFKKLSCCCRWDSKSPERKFIKKKMLQQMCTHRSIKCYTSMSHPLT